LEVSSADTAEQSEWYDILIIGTDTAVAEDNAGPVTGWDGFTQFNNIPGAEYFHTGGEAVQIVAPTTAPLSITFSSEDTPLYIEVSKHNSGGTSLALRYTDMDIPVGTALMLNLPPSSTPLLQDTNGDGRVAIRQSAKRLSESRARRQQIATRPKLLSGGLKISTQSQRQMRQV